MSEQKKNKTTKKEKKERDHPPRGRRQQPAQKKKFELAKAMDGGGWNQNDVGSCDKHNDNKKKTGLIKKKDYIIRKYRPIL